MQKRIVLGFLVLFCALAMVTPANAVVVNGVDYTFLAKFGILMEQSDDCPHDLGIPPTPPPGKVCMNIVGNVGVSDVPNPANLNQGRLQIGAKNDIVGTAIANRILFGTGSQTDTCEFNTSVPAPSVGANGQCINPPVTPLPAGTLPLVAAWPPGPLGAVPTDACVNAAGAQNVTVAAGAVLALAPGCYKAVVVNSGGTLNLSAGSYIFKSLVLKAGSTMNGAGTTQTVVNVQGSAGGIGGAGAVTEAGVKINNLTLETPGTAAQSVSEFIAIGNGSVLTNTILYAPTSAIHVHTGTNATNIEVVANFITIEPVIVNNVPPVLCACFDDFTQNDGTSVTITTGHGFQSPGVKFFISLSCDPAAGVQVPANITSDTDATLNITGLTTAGRHVIVTSTAGTFCSTKLLQ